jgi:transposase InsO family protein
MPVSRRECRIKRVSDLPGPQQLDLFGGDRPRVIVAADAFKDKTTAPIQLWQTDFTYLKVIGWGWLYLSTVLDDFSRYIVAWKLCTSMRAEDLNNTLDLALWASRVPSSKSYGPTRQPARLRRSPADEVNHQ